VDIVCSAFEMDVWCLFSTGVAYYKMCWQKSRYH